MDNPMKTEPAAGEASAEPAVSPELDDLSKLIIAGAQAKSTGLTNDELIKVVPDSTPEQRLKSLNRLLQEGLLELLTKGNSLVYRYCDPTKAVASKCSDNEEKIVYRIIEEGGCKGIWIRDIRVQSNLILTQLNKILKNLETKKMIKAVKSVNASKKKVYMLYDLEPDRSVTGGAWYQDQDFESEFVDVLNQQCLRFLQMRKEASQKLKEGPLAVQNMASCTVKDVHKFISELGISKVNLDEDDLETILKTVVYDGRAERVVRADGTSAYRAIDPSLPPPGLVQMPCGICPVIKNCASCGEITPKICAYITEWLD